MTENSKNQSKTEQVKSKQQKPKAEKVASSTKTATESSAKSKNSSAKTGTKSSAKTATKKASIKSDNVSHVSKASEEKTAKVDTAKENQKAISQAQKDEFTEIKPRKKRGALIAGICATIAILGIGGVVTGVTLVKNKTYSITINTPFPGSASGQGTTYKLGDTVTLKAEEVTGYKFEGWTLNNGEEYVSTDAEFSFKLTKELVGQWSAVYTQIDYTVESQSTYITGLPTSPVHYQDEVTFTVSDKTGYEIEKVYYTVGDDANQTTINGTNGTYSFEMPADNVKIFVTFKQVDYIITNSDSTYITELQATGNYEEIITFKVSDKTGYTLTKVYYKVSGDDTEYTLTENEGKYSFTMPAENVTVYATFSAIDYTVFNSDSTYINLSTTTAHYGDTINFTINDKTGYEIEKVYYTVGDDINQIAVNETDGAYSFEMPSGNIKIYVTFKAISYTITNSDSIHITNLQTTGIYEETITFEVGNQTGLIPYVYYVQEGQTQENTINIKNGTYEFSMPACNITIGVRYVAVNYNITNTDSTYINLTTTTAQYKDTISFTINDRTGYDIEKVYYTVGDDITQITIHETNGTYSFEMPAGDVKIYVTFKQIDYIVTNSDATCITDLQATGNYEEIITFKVSDKTGYTLTKVYYKVSGDDTEYTLTENEGKYSFTMPAENVTVYATFTAIPYTITNSDATYITDLQATGIYEETITFSVSNKIGYNLTKVFYKLAENDTEYTLTENEGQYSFSMPAENVTIYISFEAINYTITNSTPDCITELQATGNYEEIITFKVSDKTGYTLTKVYYKVSGDDTEYTLTENEGQYSFTMPAGDVAVYATFTAIPYVLSTTSESESVTFKKVIDDVLTEITTANYQDEVVIVIEERENYNIVITAVDKNDNEVTITKSGTTYSFTMPASPVYVTAEYVAIEYTLSTTSESEGVTFKKMINDELTEITTANYQDEVVIVIEERENYNIVLTAVDEDNNEVTITKSGTTYSFTMPASPVYVTAEYVIIQYSIDTISYGGTVTADKAMAVKDDLVTLTLEKESDSLDKYALTVTTQSGANVETTTNEDNTITFNMPAEDVVVNLEYYKKVQVSGNVSGYYCYDYKLTPTTDAKFFFTVPDGYSFLGWAQNDANGSIITGSTTYTLKYNSSARVYKYYALAYETTSKVEGYEMDGLVYTIYPGTNRCMITGLTEDNANATSITIPDYIEYNEAKYYIFKIADNAFKDKSTLTSVTLPTAKQFSMIGSYAFSGTSIESITLPTGVTSVGTYAFYNCTELTTADFSQLQNTFLINNYTFSGDSKLKTIKFPYLLTTIGDLAFANCSSLKGNKVYTDDQGNEVGMLDLRGLKYLTSLGAKAFMACNSLNEIYLPLQSGTLGDLVFQGRTSTKSAITKVVYGGFTANGRGLSNVKDDIANGKTLDIYISESSPAISNGAFNGAYITNAYIDSQAVYAQIVDSTSLFTAYGTSGRITNLYIRKDIVDNDTTTTEEGVTYGNTYLNDETAFTKTEEMIGDVAYIKYVKVS